MYANYSISEQNINNFNEEVYQLENKTKYSLMMLRFIYDNLKFIYFFIQQLHIITNDLELLTGTYSLISLTKHK